MLTDLFQRHFDLDQIARPRLLPSFYPMSKERTQDLARLCTELVRKGTDFPTVWSSLLKGHTLVAGIPQSKMEGGRPVLEVRLITGERFVFDGEAMRFTVG
jgi:hypothetical protein